MVNKTKAFYEPSPPPLMADAAAFRQWCIREFDRIAEVLRIGSFQMLELEMKDHSVDPAVVQVQEGAVAYFKENITGPSQKRGLYEYVNGAWAKL